MICWPNNEVAGCEPLESLMLRNVDFAGRAMVRRIRGINRRSAIRRFFGSTLRLAAIAIPCFLVGTYLLGAIMFGLWGTDEMLKSWLSSPLAIASLF